MDPPVSTLFDEEAQAAYMVLRDKQASDTVKAVILEQMGLSTEKYQQQFRAARWAGDVQPRAFGQRLTGSTTAG